MYWVRLAAMQDTEDSGGSCLTSAKRVSEDAAVTSVMESSASWCLVGKY
jgi:hypothetical protein